MFPIMHPNELYRTKQNCLSFWYPIIKEAELPSPKTIILKHEVNLLGFMDNKNIDEITGLSELIEEIDTKITNSFGYPCFIRTGVTSNKHDWENSCYLASKDDIMGHLYNLTELSCTASFLLPFYTSVLVLRELLPTKAICTAFKGNMPITKEIRCTLNKETKQIKVLRYWPREALNKKIKNETIEEVEKKLDIEYQIEGDEKDMLEAMLKFLYITFDNSWSVDFLYSEGQWFLIDMARLEDSYVNKEENAEIFIIKDLSKCVEDEQSKIKLKKI